MSEILYGNYAENSLNKQVDLIAGKCDQFLQINRNTVTADLPFRCLKVRPSPKNWFCINRTINQRYLTVVFRCCNISVKEAQVV